MTTTGPTSTSDPTTTGGEPVEAFQLSAEAAERYEADFVPALFAQWAPILCDAAGLAPGDAVLDVACGTGIVARTAGGRVAPAGSVTGLDLNEAMLTVARRLRPDVEWRQGDAAHLAFPDGTFDAVLCQMALMFLPDRPTVLAEMGRVTRPGGRVGIAVPAELARQPAFAPFVEVAARHAGDDAYTLLTAYFVCGDLDRLAAEIEEAGLSVTSAATHVGTYRAPSVDAFVTTEAESTPLVERISAEAYRRIRDEAHDVLRPFTDAEGRVEAPFATNVVVARR